MSESKSSNRCWPGYEPVPGKKPNEEGSCRPSAKSKLTSAGKAVRARRKKQLDRRKKAGVTAKQRSARRHAMPAPKGARPKRPTRAKTTRKTKTRRSRGTARRSTSRSS